mmetsp:Transcript_29719/g.85287  ORF Transcript_29719/g.85287 Transcript_29719/m.85287 type:complete len:211 (+) Transcript_29719:1961-2593(+)
MVSGSTPSFGMRASQASARGTSTALAQALMAMLTQIVLGLPRPELMRAFSQRSAPAASPALANALMSVPYATTVSWTPESFERTANASAACRSPFLALACSSLISVLATLSEELVRCGWEFIKPWCLGVCKCFDSSVLRRGLPLLGEGDAPAAAPLLALLDLLLLSKSGKSTAPTQASCNRVVPFQPVRSTLAKVCKNVVSSFRWPLSSC